MYTDYAKTDEHDRGMKYLDNVMDYLEYIGYHHIIVEFEHRPVAQFMVEIAAFCDMCGLSFRKCAILIFSITMNKQILPKTSKMTVN